MNLTKKNIKRALKYINRMIDDEVDPPIIYDLRYWLLDRQNEIKNEQ